MALDLFQRDQALELALEGDVDQEPAWLFAGGLLVEILRLRVELGFVRVRRAGDAGQASNARPSLPVSAQF